MADCAPRFNNGEEGRPRVMLCLQCIDWQLEM